jgi:hypothetical protein
VGRRTDELEQLTATWKQIAEGQLVADEVSYWAAVRILTDRLAALVRPGEPTQPYVQALLARGYRRATAYKVVKAAFAIAAERRVQTAAPPSRVAARSVPARPAPTVAPPRETEPAAPAPSILGPKPASVPAAASPGRPSPREHYRADALPSHIVPGMTLPAAQDGGRVWIDCLPFDAHRDAPFGYDAHGAPWAPYGRDAQGRFRNYLGAALGVAGRTGRGHFVGEPDAP